MSALSNVEGQAGRRTDSQPSAQTQKTTTFPIYKPSELMALNPDTEVPILGDDYGKYWVKGAPALVLGGCGIGKSRWVLGFAVCDILKRDFCGFQTFGAGKWLILGSETSALRARNDLLRLIARGGMTAEQHTELDEKLRILAATPGEEMPPTNLDDLKAIEALQAAAAEHRPDVVVVDPWEAFIRSGDVNDASETRKSFNHIQRIFRPATLLAVHHSREGVEAVKRASGFDSTSFTKGAKTLVTMARLAFNLTPLHATTDAAEKGHGVVINCGKINDSRPFASRAVVFSDESGTYTVDKSFDAQRYRDDVEGKHRKHAVTIQQVVDVVRRGITKLGEIVAVLCGETAASASTAKRAIGDACAKDYLKSPRHGHYELGPKASKVEPLSK
jgi:hypothetical protein